jgi:ubiquinone/menaquinone biosynthesis C-methylase UbiE
MEVDFAELKDRTRAAWSLGNYSEVARLIEPAARELVEECGIAEGQEVLDVAAGNGNVAVLAARRGAKVVASDLTPAMVELGRARSEHEGLAIEWTEADAEELPFEDGRFDCVTSVLGAMFAPRPARVGAELFRVTMPGGLVGMANWTPSGYMGEMLALNREFETMPAGLEPATEWGREDVVAERFAELAAEVRCLPRRVPFRFESLDAMSDWFEENAGPSQAARKSLSRADYEALRRRLGEVVDRHNAAADGSVAIDAPYLLVVARKRR